MGLKDWLIAGVATKALKSSQRPGVISPPGYTVIGMTHKGIAGSNWKITYIKDDQPNMKLNFTIKKGITGRSEGSGKWPFHWS